METIPQCSGIYQITCVPSGKIYIGSAIHLRTRWYGHTSMLNRGIHKNGHLQSAWNKYGGASFTFTVVEFVDPDLLLVKEQEWIDKTHCCDRQVGFNLNERAQSRRGMRYSPETLARITAVNRDPAKRALASAALKIRKAEPEARARVSRQRKGVKATPETRAKISAASRGRKQSQETIVKRVTSLKARYALLGGNDEKQAEMKHRWQDPRYREMMAAQSKALWSDPAYRERILRTRAANAKRKVKKT